MDQGAVVAAVDELARMLRADGGDLVLVSADPKIDRITLRLVLDDVSCADCVLAPDMLFDTVHAALERRVTGEFELVLDDPRRAES
jgi:Fe-S cluster biogenesis protein NfuA